MFYTSCEVYFSQFLFCPLDFELSLEPGHFLCTCKDSSCLLRMASNRIWKCPPCVIRENGVPQGIVNCLIPLSIMRTVSPQSSCNTMPDPCWVQGWTSISLDCWWSVWPLCRCSLQLQTWAPQGNRSRLHTQRE